MACNKARWGQAARSRLPGRVGDVLLGTGRPGCGGGGGSSGPGGWPQPPTLPRPSGAAGANVMLLAAQPTNVAVQTDCDGDGSLDGYTSHSYYSPVSENGPNLQSWLSDCEARAEIGQLTRTKEAFESQAETYLAAASVAGGIAAGLAIFPVTQPAAIAAAGVAVAFGVAAFQANAEADRYRALAALYGTAADTPGNQGVVVIYQWRDDGVGTQYVAEVMPQSEYGIRCDPWGCEDEWPGRGTAT